MILCYKWSFSLDCGECFISWLVVEGQKACCFCWYHLIASTVHITALIPTLTQNSTSILYFNIKFIHMSRKGIQFFKNRNAILISNRVCTFFSNLSVISTLHNTHFLFGLPNFSTIKLMSSATFIDREMLQC